MAKNGSLSTSRYGTGDESMGLRCTWEAASQSVLTNKTIIDWTLESEGGNGFQYYAGAVALEINGETVYSHPDRFLMDGGGAWSVSGSLEIEHDADGAKEFEIFITAGVYAWQSSNCTGRGSFELDPILRGLVPIGDKLYQAYIGNGVSWDAYGAYKGNGTSFDMFSA